MSPKQFALNLAKQAGVIITKYFYIEHHRELKADHSPVTIADKIINKLVADGIKQQFPDYGFIGEEGGSFNEKAEYVWICDPLDGTIPFSHGVPVCSFALALLHEGKPILGLIYNPFIERLYFAEANKGAFLNDRPIHVNNDDTLTRGLVGICTWNRADYDISKTFQKLISLGVNYQTGSAAYLGALVASGDAVANIFPHGSPWDMAAVQIIVEEAGGKVTDMFGHEQLYNQKTKGAVASNGVLHDQLIEIIQRTLPK